MCCALCLNNYSCVLELQSSIAFGDSLRVGELVAGTGKCDVGVSVLIDLFDRIYRVWGSYNVIELTCNSCMNLGRVLDFGTHDGFTC